MDVGLAVERSALASGFGLLGKYTRILKILIRVKEVDLCGYALHAHWTLPT